MRADDVADLSREQWEHLIEQYIFNEQHRRIFFSPFKKCCKREHLAIRLGVFFMSKKSHRWDTYRGSLAEVRVA